MAITSAEARAFHVWVTGWGANLTVSKLVPSPFQCHGRQIVAANDALDIVLFIGLCSTYQTP